MLSTPQSGWTDFQLKKSKTFSLSYLTDVANEWLEQAIHGLETMDTFSVHGVCEPGRMICTVSYWSCYIIFEEEDQNPAYKPIKQVHITMLDFCKQLYADITKDLDAWIHWDESSLALEVDDAGLQRRVQKRKTCLQVKLDKLKLLIDEKAIRFGPGGGFL